MTVVGDKVIQLLGLGKRFHWPTSKECAAAIEYLRQDPEFDATIKQLHTRKYIGEFFGGIRSTVSSPTVFDAAMVLAGRANDASAGMIEKELGGYFRDPDAEILTSYFGNCAQIFGIAQDLANSMRGYHVLAVSAGEPSTKAKISKNSGANFTGSGATGRDIFKGNVKLVDQAAIGSEQVFYEASAALIKGEKWVKRKLGYQVHPFVKAAPEDRGDVSKAYGNPDFNKLLPKTQEERINQALRVSSLPISTVFKPIYPNGPPSRAAVIRAAAKQYRLTPEVIGAVILTEQRHQSYDEDSLDFVGATHRVYSQTTSIGLGQVRDRTVKDSDLFSGLLTKKRRESLNRKQISLLLACDEFNIFAAAKYIRHVANQGSKLPPGREKDLALERWPGLDLPAFAKHAKHWPKPNVSALGSEYTSSPWDDKFNKAWGDHVRDAVSDMKDANVRSIK